MVLYHASQIKNLKLISPQRTISNNHYIGDYVFATANKRLAIMYLVPKGVATLMNPDGDNPNIVICGNKKELIKKDKGGAIYELPGEFFVNSPQKGLEVYEKVSQQPVKPLKKDTYDSFISALTSEGIKIRFTNEPTFNKLIRHPEQAKMIEKIAVYNPQKTKII